jgi:Tol biopolymer transport system component
VAASISMHGRVVLALTIVAAFQLLVAAAADAAFPGDNGRIAFSNEVAGSIDIYSIAPDGSELQRLTDSPGRDIEPAWSADGRRIAFASNRGGAFGEFDIYVMNADGSNETQITAVAGTDSAPAGRRTAAGSPSTPTATATSRST